jgi:hypothetical protein
VTKMKLSDEHRETLARVLARYERCIRQWNNDQRKVWEDMIFHGDPVDSVEVGKETIERLLAVDGDLTTDATGRIARCDSANRDVRGRAVGAVEAPHGRWTVPEAGGGTEARREKVQRVQRRAVGEELRPIPIG